MSLRDPDSRRALRAVIEAIIGLALMVLLYWITGKLEKDASGLREIARGALIITGMATLFYGAENVTRAVNFKLGPLEGGIGEDPPKQPPAP